jgi:predicted nucleic acid-binding protein
MTFLLDTNAVSEWIKPRPNAGLVTWLAETEEDSVYLSVVTLAELRHGVAGLAAGRRRERLDHWLTHELPGRFEGRILPIEASIADQWGRLSAAAKAAGRPIHAMDAFLAATARVHNLTIVTRDLSAFDPIKVPAFSPWSES